MSRINKLIVEGITNNALEKSGINKKKLDHVKRRAAWAEKVRVEALGGKAEAAKIQRAVNGIKKKVKELPEVIGQSISIWSMNDGSCKVEINGQRATAHLDGKQYNRDTFVNQWAKYDHDLICKTGMTLKITDKHPLAKEWMKLEKERDVLLNEQLELQGKIAGSVRPGMSIKKLVEVWPEVVELMAPEWLRGSAPSLPAVPVTELNKEIGLPSKKGK